MPTVTDHALALLTDGMTIGLGTGRAASDFIEGLGQRVKKGQRVRGVPTSQASADLAKKLGIPVVTLEEAGELDLAFDGADEVDPDLNLIKGYGGALVREKIVAASARKFVVLVGEGKLVSYLGQRGKLPVEIVPFGLPLCRRRLASLGFVPELRQGQGKPFVSDNGNFILDCQCKKLEQPERLEREILAIPGVVGSGMFLNMTSLVLAQDGDRVLEKQKGR